MAYSEIIVWMQQEGLDFLVTASQMAEGTLAQLFLCQPLLPNWI